MFYCISLWQIIGLTSTLSTVATLPAALGSFSAPDRGPRPVPGKVGVEGVTTPVDADEVMLLGFQQGRCKADSPLTTNLSHHSGSGWPGSSG